MKIYVLDAFHLSGVELAEKQAEVIRWDDPRAKNWHEDADGLMVRGKKVAAEDMARAKKLRVISKQGVGLDNIDLEAAKAHGIAVCRTPGVNSEAVAEMALSLGLSVVRRVTEFDRMTRADGKVQRANFLGYESWQKTVGIVGMGNIGTLVARKWRGAFDAKIIGYDPYVPANRWSELPHKRAVSLEEMLPQVDILSLHLPLTPESRNMIDATRLALMKPSAIVVNTSRGGIVNEAALYQAISSGKLFGAGFDVFEVEPPTSDHPLMSLPTFVGTPHAAAGTIETQARSSMLAASQLLEALAGGQPLGQVA
ncbi:hydroxyacid dehydrogenase [Bradyrhizobium sp.]|jgi:D-3-phosphoglycerate dehydrogenase|uniref:hydroxyacid dehydrogenase n=1 Tax=Bradyrhizobium sp. TaxID=376 RepID=UPI003C2443E6